jgi:DNA excision repair protein ERCC-2
VIRTTEDRGVLILMDDRFTRPEVQALLPAWWAGGKSEPANESLSEPHK